MEDRRRRRHSNQSESDCSDEDESPDVKPLKSETKEQDHIVYLQEDGSEYESITETYDDDDTYDETTTEAGTEFTEDDVIVEGEYEESYLEEERQSGDGQEQSDDNKEQNLDDDEDRKNPAYIPRKGAFYEHDDRLGEDEAQEAPAPTETSKEVDRDDPKVMKKKLWVEAEKWEHNKFVSTLQAPKTREEIIAMYGYDIRAHSEPPEGATYNNMKQRKGNRGRRSNKLQDYMQPSSGDVRSKSNYADQNKYQAHQHRPTKRDEDLLNDSNQTRGKSKQGPFVSSENSYRVDNHGDNRKQSWGEGSNGGTNRAYNRNSYNNSRDSYHSENNRGVDSHCNDGHGADGHRTRGRGGFRGRGHGVSGYRRGEMSDLGGRGDGQGSSWGSKGPQTYSKLRSNSQDYPAASRQPLSPQWADDTADQGKVEQGMPENVPCSSDASWAKQTETEDYYIEDIIPPVTTPYTNTTRTNAKESRGPEPLCQDSRPPPRRQVRKAASEDDLLEILPPTTTVYTAVRPARGLDGFYQHPDAKGRPPKRYSSQRQRNLAESSSYSEMSNDNIPPVTMATASSGGTNNPPGSSGPGFNARPRGQVPIRNIGSRQVRLGPQQPPQAAAPRQLSPRQLSPRHPQHHSPRQAGQARQQHPGGSPRMIQSRGKMSTGVAPPSRPRQAAMFVRPGLNQSPPHTVTSFPQPPILATAIQAPLVSIAYTIPGGSPVAGQARLYTTTAPATPVTSHLSHFITPAAPPQPVLSYGPPPSAPFQIAAGSVPVQLPVSMTRSQDTVPVQFPPSSDVSQAQEAMRICGGTTYFSPEVQTGMPAQEGIHVRGGTTYFNPVPQVITLQNRQQMRRTKAAIPIVNPQVTEDGGYFASQGDGYSAFYPDGAQQYEFSQGQQYEFYGSFDDGIEGEGNSAEYSQEGCYGDQHQRVAEAEDDECDTPTNEQVDNLALESKSTFELLESAEKKLKDKEFSGKSETKEEHLPHASESETPDVASDNVAIDQGTDEASPPPHGAAPGQVNGDQITKTPVGMHQTAYSDEDLVKSTDVDLSPASAPLTCPEYTERSPQDTNDMLNTAITSIQSETTLSEQGKEGYSLDRNYDSIKESTPESEEFSECVESLPVKEI